MAREHSPTLRAARERVRRGEALLDEAKALAYPRLDARGSVVRFIEAADFRGRTGTDVSGSGTRTRFFTGTGSDIYTAGLDLSYPLFDGGDAYYARREARAGLEAAREDAESAQEDLELLASTAFLNLILSEGAIEIAAESLGFGEEEERRARAREEAGEALSVDRLRFSTRASEARLSLSQARAERRRLLAALGEVVATPLADDLKLRKPEAGLDTGGEDSIALALEHRSDLSAARARVDAAKGRLSREYASWWPSLRLFASYGLISLDDIQLSKREDELQVGGALTLNLFEGGAAAARVAALRQEVAELESRASEIALRIEREVRESEIDLAMARESVEVSERTQTLAGEVLKRVTAQYAAGEVRVLDVTEAEVQRTRARLAFLRSQVQVLLAQARLRRALGLGIWRSP
jgi:outer membrane protein TolC